MSQNPYVDPSVAAQGSQHNEAVRAQGSQVHAIVRVLSEEEQEQRRAQFRADMQLRREREAARAQTVQASAAEADVVDAARRSQAEIRRHVDAYLKEHFESIAADVAKVVIEQVHQRIVKGVADMQEAQQFALDRIAADVRSQLRAFARGAWGKPVTAKSKKGKVSR